MTALGLAALPDEDLLARVGAMDAAVSPAPPVDAAALAYDWRALTVRWPHVAAIVYPAPAGCVPKRAENRTYATSRRGRILIHAGKAWDARSTVSLAQRHWENCGGLAGIDFDAAQGAIVAVADLTDCHPSDGVCCRPWGETGADVWHWSLGNVRRLPEPVPAKGALGFWRPGADVLAPVLRQLAGVAS